jgi:hypothetical protein
MLPNALTGWLVRAAVVLLSFGAVARAEDTQSGSAARELSALMEQHHLEALAARNPDTPDGYIAARLYPGVQLLVVAGRPASPSDARYQLDRKDYAGLYATLHQAVVPETKVFIQDLKADGLRPKPREAVDIVYEKVTQQTVFDGAPSKHNLSDAEYDGKFAAADRLYARLLTILAEGLRTAATATDGTPENAR